MIIQHQVGPVATTASIAPGSQAPARAGALGDLIVSKFAPDLYEGCYRRQVFGASVQAARVTSVGLTLAYTGLILSNAPGNTVNAVVLNVGCAFPVAPAAVIILGLFTGYSTTAVTHTTAVTPRSLFYGVGASPQCLVDESATQPVAAIITHVFGSVGTGAVTVANITQGFFDLKGQVILPPGAWCGIYTSQVANTAGFLGSISWMELPI